MDFTKLNIQSNKEVKQFLVANVKYRWGLKIHYSDTDCNCIVVLARDASGNEMPIDDYPALSNLRVEMPNHWLSHQDRIYPLKNLQLLFAKDIIIISYIELILFKRTKNLSI